MPDQVTYKDFSAKIKTKYPEYSDVDDLELAKKMVEKYPEYSSSVIFEEPIKKKEESVVGVGESGVSPSLSSTPDRELSESGEVGTLQKPLKTESEKYAEKEKSEMLAGVTSDTERQKLSTAIDRTNDFFKGIGGKTPYQKMQEFNSRLSELNKKLNPSSFASMSSEDLAKVEMQYKQDAINIASQLGLEIGQDGNIRPPKNEMDAYTAKLGDNISAIETEKQKEKGFFSNLASSLASGYSSASGATLDLLGTLSGLNYFDAYRDLATGDRFNAETFKQQANKYDKNIEQYTRSGDLDKAAGLAITSAVESLPYMIPALINPEYGVYVMGGMSGIDKYRELEESKIPEWEKVYNAVSSGTFEAIFEKLGTGAILSRSKRAILELGEKRGKDAIVNAVTKTVENSASKIGRMPEWVKEGISEVATGVGQDITDKVTVNPEKKIGENSFDNFTVGAVMGKVFALPQDVAKGMDRMAARDFAKKVVDKLPADMDIETKIALGWKIAERDKLVEAENKLDEKFKGKYATQIVTLNTEIDEIANKYLGKAKAEEVPELSVGKMQEDGGEQQKLDYLKEKGVEVPDGTTTEQLNTLFEEQKQKEQKPEQKQKEEVVSVAAEQVSKTAPKEEAIKPTEAISEPVEPLSPKEAPIVLPEQKEGLKQTKQESVVGGEPLKDVESTKKALDVVGFDSVAEFMPKETDQRKRQELENAISEGEMLMKSGKKVSGKKMTKEEIFVIQKSVDNAKKQLGIIPYSSQDVSELYQKAKQDGSNPELVKAVEGLIGKQQNIPLQEQITEVKQVKQQENGKETSDEAQGRKEGRQEELLKKNEEADALLSEGLSDIADLLGTKLSLTGEQRVKVKDAVRKVARGLILKGEVKAEQLAMAIKDYFSKAGHDISDELINETLKEEGYAEGIRTTASQAGQQAQGVVEGEKGRIRVRDDAKDRVEAKEGEGVRATASKTHKPTAKETTTKIGRFAVRVALDETKVPQAVKDAFTEREIGKYNTMSDAEAMGIAEGIAAANTYEEMKKIVFDSNVHPSVRGAVVLKLREIMTNEYDKAEKEGNKADMVFWSDQAIDFLEDFNDKVHETALTLRFLGTQAFMESFAPFQHVREYQRKVNDERDKLINSKTHKKSFETVKKESKKVRDAAVDGALNDPAVKNIINKNSEKEPTFVPKDRLKQLKEKERAAIEKLRKALRGGTLTSGGINSEALEALGELAVVYVEEAGYVVAKAVKKLIKTAKDVGITLTEKEAQGLMPKEVDGKPIEDKIAEEATEKAAEKLASRIFGEVISSRKKEDPLLQMVNTLLGKFKERDLTKTKKESKTDIQKIAEAIVNKEEYIEVWTEAKDQAISKVEENEMLTDDQKQQAIDRINKAYDNATSFTFTEAQIDRAIKKKSASLGIRIDQIVKEFYEIQTTERGRLVDALIEESGLEAEQARLLASAIENRFDVLLAEGKKKIVDKYIGKITGDKTEAGQITTKTRKDAVSEFLELVNIGAFQSEAFREAYATAVGIPVFTQAHADKIDKLAKEIRRQKEPIMKHKATQELMGYRQIIAGFGLSDIMTTAWYGNVLGNIKTQERNFFGGWTGVAARLMAEAVVTGRPRAIFRGYVKSMREAAAKFKDVWTEGYAPFSERIDIPPSVELMRGTGLLRVLMTYWRYTRRAMDALDVWNATTGKIAFAEILANEALNVNRFKSTFNSKYRREVNQLVDKYLSVDAETVKRLKQEIEDDAAEFGYTDIDKKLILYDKIDRLRPSEVSEQAIRFGIFSTGNVQAYGTLGIISDNLAKLFRFKLPVYKNSKTGEVKYIQPLSFIAAFTKIAGNVGTMSMNFVPGVGVYRIVQGGYGKLYTDKDGKGNYFSKYSVDLTEREKKTIIGMQIAGAVSMSLLWSLSDPGDDDDPLIRVTADGTGDWTKNRALSGEEWKEYSIGIKNPSGGRTWISYKYTPMIIPFSPIGFIRDSKKYRKEYKDKNTLELFGETLLQMPSALADMTALSSMNDFMSGVLKLGETAEYSKVIKSLERIVSGFYTPGLYRDVVDAIETMYGIGIDEPMKGVPEYEAKLLKERFLGRNPISIYKRIKNGTEYTDRVDVYGRKVEKIMPYNDIIAVKPEMNEEEKMIFRHQKIMGNPSVPQVKQTFFKLENPDGSTTDIFLNTSDPFQDELWHKYIIARGRSIVEAMSIYQSLDEDVYKYSMEKAIVDATNDARLLVSYELNANPPKKIKEWQKARKE